MGRRVLESSETTDDLAALNRKTSWGGSSGFEEWRRNVGVSLIKRTRQFFVVVG
jgi:hypothetical protein